MSRFLPLWIVAAGAVVLVAGVTFAAIGQMSHAQPLFIGGIVVVIIAAMGMGPGLRFILRWLRWRPG